jgi:anti-anti-sigma factor
VSARSADHAGPSTATHAERRTRLAIATTSVGYRSVLSPAGRLDAGSVDRLREALRHAAERDIWIDLTDVTAMDASGVDALLEASRALDGDHRRLAVIAPPGGPARRALAAVDGAVPLYASRQDANRAT